MKWLAVLWPVLVAFAAAIASVVYLIYYPPPTKEARNVVDTPTVKQSPKPSK